MTRIAAAVLALSLAVVTPVLAQGKGKENNKAKGQEHGKQAVTQTVKGKSTQTAKGKSSQTAKGKSTYVAPSKGNQSARQAAVRRDSRGNIITSSSVKSKSGSPAFCRNGAGHPVYGRSWCVEKGFGLGSARWDRATWGDVILRNRRTASIGDVLGSVILGRVTDYAAQRLGLRSPLTGTWLVNSQDRSVYLVRSGSTPVAEFVDTNYDGRADFVLLHH